MFSRRIPRRNEAMHLSLESQKASDRVYDAIRNLIIDGSVRPGEHLTEAQLATNLGFSRTPIRDAIKRLKAEGLLVKGPNNGAAVPQLTDEDVRSIREIRCLLEGYAAERAARYVEPSEVEELSALAQRMAEMERLEALPVRQFTDANIRFHLSIAEIARSTHLYSQIARLVQIPIILMRRGSWPGDFARARGCQQHFTIIDAIRSGDSVWAGNEMRAHISSSLHQERMTKSGIAPGAPDSLT